MSYLAMRAFPDALGKVSVPTTTVTGLLQEFLSGWAMIMCQLPIFRWGNAKATAIVTVTARYVYILFSSPASSKIRQSQLSASLFAFPRDILLVINEMLLRMYVVVSEQAFPKVTTAMILAPY
jgi:hypothetical protein